MSAPKAAPLEEWVLSLPDEDRKRLSAILLLTPFAKEYMRMVWDAGAQEGVRRAYVSAELRGAINAVLLAYETAIRPGTLSDSDLWPALAELRRAVDAQIAQEHPLYHGEGVEHMDTDYNRLRRCPMCSAETGQPCKVLSNYDGTYKPGDTRPVPHFYRTEIGK